MFLGKVVGTVWATKKTANLNNLRFLIVRTIDFDQAPTDEMVITADVLGAGIGETVLCAYGRAARLAVGNENVSIEAAVVGIVDEVEVDQDGPSPPEKTQ